MKAKVLREQSNEQLQNTMKEAIDALFTLRLQAQNERMNASSELKRNRKLVAQVKTILRERVAEEV
ncbi:MAG: 50S ribosomal protein L29 [Planctomycetaceae bacterium]|nr:50S ribosomal protein L29 [Planctomycetaceae bacterium]MBQ2822288.1 50S ribosomal protein L29 [Thermoguttaceae bacterium]